MSFIFVCRRIISKHSHRILKTCFQIILSELRLFPLSFSLSAVVSKGNSRKVKSLCYVTHVVYKDVAKNCLVPKSSIFLFLCFVVLSIYFLFFIFFYLFFNLLSNHAAILLGHSVTNSDNHDFSLPVLHWSKEKYGQKTAASAMEMLNHGLLCKHGRQNHWRGKKNKFLLGKKVLMFKTLSTWNTSGTPELQLRSTECFKVLLYTLKHLRKLKFRHCGWKCKFVLWLHFNILKHYIFTSSHVTVRVKGLFYGMFSKSQMDKQRSTLIISILNFGSGCKEITW